MLFVLLTLSAGCTPDRLKVDDLCAIYQVRPEWRGVLDKVESDWGISQELVMSVIRYESNFEGDARAPRKRYLFGLIPGERLSSAYGYSQALEPTWEEYQQRTGKTDTKRNHFEDAADFVGWYLSRAHRSLQIPRNDGYHLYLVYHQGHTGFLRGDYERKERLKAVARKVERSRLEYRQQLTQCQPDKQS